MTQRIWIEDLISKGSWLRTLLGRPRPRVTRRIHWRLKGGEGVGRMNIEAGVDSCMLCTQPSTGRGIMPW